MRSRGLCITKDHSAALLGVLLICLIGMVVLIQQRIDRQRAAFQNVQSFSYLPSGRYLRVAALEFREVTADILWFRAIQFVGGRDPSGLGYEWFYGVLDRVTDLDERFAYVYQFGGVVLSILSDHVDLSNAILEKGLKNVPTSWQIPFDLGFNYLYHLHDPLRAAHYMEIASRLDGHPPYLPFLAARLYQAGEDFDTGLLLLEALYRTTTDERTKEAIVEKIDKLRAERDLAMAKKSRPDSFGKKD
jgi:hypothetical protein